MKKLYFVRHGESEFNKSGRWGGQVETKLTADGRAQAKKAGQMAREQELKFNQIVASPLSRAYDTAVIIAKEIGFPEDKIIAHELFKERSFGELEGTKSDPDHPLYGNYPKDQRVLDEVPGAETLDQLIDRASESYKYLQSLPGDTILVVAHGAYGRALRSQTDKNGYDPTKHFPNAEIFQLI